MAYDNNFGGEEDIKGSKYNEAFFKMTRFHHEQEKINMVRDRPLNLFTDDTTGHEVRGYTIWFSSLTNLFLEVASKLTKDELDEAQKLKSKIEFLLINFPPHQVVTNRVSHMAITSPSKLNWILLRPLLFEFELLIKKYMEVHKYSSPEEDESGLF